MSNKATHFRQMVDEMDDEAFVRWIEGIAHLKLRHACDCSRVVGGGARPASLTGGVRDHPNCRPQHTEGDRP